MQKTKNRAALLAILALCLVSLLSMAAMVVGQQREIDMLHQKLTVARYEIVDKVNRIYELNLRLERK
ncbi:MAG: hypothetical protein P3W91_001885 [Fervidobacterium sp.]|jgi:hypothetical protein|nr:hypothetical protein [Guyparkeria sp. 1SP6A2]MDM7320463.1 hypothetical protein [Fervidobacterium sp.]